MCKPVSWKISLHGGHSSGFCDHASSTLGEMLDAAVAFGYHCFGVAEHAPRPAEKYLYAEEIQMGWDVKTLDRLFRAYADAMDQAVDACTGRLQVLKAFEAEVVPQKGYAENMLAYKRELNFDYIVGSVHYVDDIIIDYKREYFEQALEACGGYERLVVRYYQILADMVSNLRPEVIGHFDIVRKGFPIECEKELYTPRAKAAAEEALEAMRQFNCILDINTAGYRKGSPFPYPAPVYVQLARDLGIPVCFGDDSHDARQVGEGIEQAREYLLSMGINRIMTLERGVAGLNRVDVSLLDAPGEN
ncbi:MAG TPA: histidinol-phosphatase [Candidatus Hydrogenedentes bacterium]|nr:histidinol-phosphatase [Candidatus Hydrogenedentota bacterium]HOC69371.1 histidinol-phosphatase [Candidatus Hydrogenedentota bacterium]